MCPMMILNHKKVKKAVNFKTNLKISDKIYFLKVKLLILKKIDSILSQKSKLRHFLQLIPYTPYIIKLKKSDSN